MAPHRFAERLVRIGGHLLQTTAAYDTYWKFAAERQAIFFRRLSDARAPWTDDPILGAHRFTNVYRASDRVSQYLIRNVIYKGEPSAEEVFFRTMLFKLFNRIETWETLTACVGVPSWRDYDYRRYNDCLTKAFESGQTIYSAAYIMPSPAFGEARKHSNHLRLIEHMMADSAPSKVTTAGSLKELFDLLRGYPSLGDFLAFQFAIDLNYSDVTSFSEMAFVVAGPGAKDGISKCFVGADVKPDDVIRYMADVAEEEFQRLGLTFRMLGNRRLQLIDCQNVFCELSKYARIAHPEIEGISGRTRIKQKFSLNSASLPQMYPPKWNVTLSLRERKSVLSPQLGLFDAAVL
jgi:alpha-glutamyl/putrescinyl thymine pyrophosphorylase clade 1